MVIGITGGAAPEFEGPMGEVSPCSHGPMNFRSQGSLARTGVCRSFSLSEQFLPPPHWVVVVIGIAGGAPPGLPVFPFPQHPFVSLTSASEFGPMGKVLPCSHGPTNFRAVLVGVDGVGPALSL